MAVKNIAVTDTLETFRTTFNDLAANDFGDIANLSGAISATDLVGAMNETISIALIAPLNVEISPKSLAAK